MPKNKLNKKVNYNKINKNKKHFMNNNDKTYLDKCNSKTNNIKKNNLDKVNYKNKDYVKNNFINEVENYIKNPTNISAYDDLLHPIIDYANIELYTKEDFQFFINVVSFDYSKYNFTNKPELIQMETPIIFKNIESNIQTISDILDIIEEYPVSSDVKYNINMESLHAIKIPLRELDSMIGLNSLKTDILNQILYFIQGFHENSKNDYMHTVISGPPGTGKTKVATIMGQIFSKLGILKKNIFKKVSRADLIAGYLGQTSIKTKDVIESCLGGVLFIDEAYSLGNVEKRDSFSKECIDTLCESLSNHKDNLMVIIAGYDDELQECFFNYNKGLESRFVWKFKTDEYDYVNLFEIFVKIIYENNWELIDKKQTLEWFKINHENFKGFGRDIESLFTKIKISHSRRIFGLAKEHKKKITITDVRNGFTVYKNNKKNDDEEYSKKEKFRTMYS